MSQEGHVRLEMPKGPTEQHLFTNRVGIRRCNWNNYIYIYMCLYIYIYVCIEKGCIFGMEHGHSCSMMFENSPREKVVPGKPCIHQQPAERGTPQSRWRTNCLAQAFGNKGGSSGCVLLSSSFPLCCKGRKEIVSLARLAQIDVKQYRSMLCR